jgi:hypothetical protein
MLLFKNYFEGSFNGILCVSAVKQGYGEYYIGKGTYSSIVRRSYLLRSSDWELGSRRGYEKIGAKGL